MSGITFTSHWPLWLLALLPLVWWAAARSRSNLGKGRTIFSTTLRSLVLGALALALAQPVLNKAQRDVSVVYALDVSRSVSPAFVNAALEWAEQANSKGKPAQTRYVVFGDNARLVDSPEAVRDIAVTDHIDFARNAINQSGTNLEQALNLAALGFAPDHAKRLVLMSDGNQTEGDVWRSYAQLQMQGVRVFAVPASVSVDNDAWVEAIETAPGIRRGEAAMVKVRVFARTDGAAKVELKNGSESVGAQSTQLRAGANNLAFKVTFKQQGVNALSAQVSAESDQVKDNDRLEQNVTVGPAPRVLLVEREPEGGVYLRDSLRKQGVDVALVSADKFAANPAQVKSQDAVILSDVAAEQLTPAVAKQLDVYVRDQGGGLIFVAGESTYGEKGLAKNDVEKLLPVKFEGEGKRKDLDLVLLLDRSFSMRGQKLEYAKSAALGALDLLEEQHRLAVVGFDTVPEEIVPLAPVGNKRKAEDLMSSLQASGQTNIFNAMLYAYRLLENSQAKAKHIILMSDGDTAPVRPGADASADVPIPAIQMAKKLREEAQRKETEQANLGSDKPIPTSYPEMAERMTEKKITLSTVIIGELPNVELMTNLARWTNGKSYLAATDQEIPQLFVTETKRMLREAIVEEPFRPLVKRKGEAIAGVDFTKGPELKGYVVSKAREFSEVLLEAKDKAPLLAQTHYGLGKTVAFMSDAKNHWAADWVNWPGYSKLWAQVVRDAMRRDSGDDLVFNVARQGKEAVVSAGVLNATGEYRNQLAPKVRVVAPDGKDSVLPLRQVAPGRYEVRLALNTSSAAPYRFELVASGDLPQAQLAKVGTRSLYYPYPDEYRVLPADRELLKTLSEQTGGKFTPKFQDVFANYGDGGRVSKALWPLLAAAALALYLLEIFVRRSPWPAR
jgi:uncharacterized membrane protein